MEVRRTVRIKMAGRNYDHFFKGGYSMFKLKDVVYKDILDIKELSIEERCITCITGESGSGKTTLLKLLDNMISCDSGTISYRGRDIDSLNPVELRRKVVMLTQVPVIFDGTVRDNLLAGLKFSEKPAARDSELLDAMGLVHLAKQLDDSAEKLSGGEKQRLAIGRVVLMKPEVFLLDEPSSALDDNTERLVMDSLVRHVKERGASMIVVTHSRDMAQLFGERCIRMAKGRISLNGEGGGENEQ